MTVAPSISPIASPISDFPGKPTCLAMQRLSFAAAALIFCVVHVSAAEPAAEALKKLADMTPEQLWREGGSIAVKDIVGLIDSASPGADSQARLALHGLVLHLGRPAREADRRKLVEALAAALEGGHKPTTTAVVIRELQHARGREAAAALGRFLLDPDLCEYATLALTSFADAPSADELRRALSQATGRCRTTLLGGLGAVRDPASADAFLKALGDADRDTRLVAAEALAELGDAAASGPLLQAATGADSTLQKGKLGASCLRLAHRLVEQGKPADAERFLLQLWTAPPDPANVNLRCATLHELGHHGGDEAGKILAEIARGADARLARAAVRGMAGQGGRELAWFTSLADAGETIRVMFIEEVAVRDPPALQAVVLAGLGSPAVAVQAAALKAVRGNPGGQVIAAITPLLGHHQKELVAAASAALCRIPGKETDVVLVAALSGATPQAARETFAVLGARLAREQVPALVAGLASQDPGVRQAAARALGAAGSDDQLPLLIEKVVAADGDEDRKAAGEGVVALARRSPGRPQAIAAVLGALAAATGPARAELLRAVGRFHEAGCFAAVMTSLDDADPAVRGVAVQALADWPEATAIEPLRRVIKGSRESAHRSLALRGLVRLLPAMNESRIRSELAKLSLPKKEMQAAYTTAYTDAMLADLADAMAAAELPEDRKVILQAIRNHPHPKALGLAKTALADPDAVVRGEAEACLVSLAERLGDAEASKAAVIAVLEEVAASSKDQGRVTRCRELLGKFAAKP